MSHRIQIPGLGPARAFGAALMFLAAGVCSAENRVGQEPVDFTSQIRPILSGKCFKCHGPDEGSRKAKLRLDLRSEAIKDRDGVHAIKPQAPDESELIARVRSTDPDNIMPPPKEGAPLAQSEVALIERWIAEGAPYSAHWAFVKPAKPPVPAVQTSSWIRNAIDAFTLRKLEEYKLQPSPEADRHTLVRRLSLDIIGLPPSPAETAAFVEDQKLDAYERLVDRLLNSPGYGERWARVWLDLARYADSAGYGSDPLRLNIWPWRDWVINALNKNLGYDRFTIEQLAGDLLQDPTQDQLIATAFHRNTMTNTEGGTDDEEFRVAAVKDRANTTAQIWMGLTMGCAQCHSHKYDPISQSEYYQFYSFFNQTEDTDKPDEQPTLPLPTPEEKERIDRFNDEIARLEKQRKEITPEFEADLAQWEELQLRGIDWQPLESVEMKSYRGAKLEKLSDHSILAIGDSPDTDAYTIRVRPGSTNLTAVRLELLPHESLPANGPGRARGTGRVVVSELSLAVQASSEPVPKARFIRVELPGSQRILSLAEVEVFSEGANLAGSGESTQSSTVSDAGAGRATDGNQDGDFEDGSVTMTEPQGDPWWEVDLGKEIPVDEIVIWNRTDRGLGTRLAGYKVAALDSERKSVWDKSVSAPPEPVEFFRVPKERSVKLENASADFAEKDFSVSELIDGKGSSNSGWSIGEKTGDVHRAAFEIGSRDVMKEPDSLLIFTLLQNHGTNHTIGRFRLSATTQLLPVRIPPQSIAKILGIDRDSRNPEQRTELNDYFRDFAPSLADVSKELTKLRRDLATVKPVALPIMRELPSKKERENHILAKGNFLSPGDTVEPGTPAAFHPLQNKSPSNRLGLARWLMDPENPLTARVAVNRLWAQLFGAGIVETEEDFGTQGSMPSHPALLDWLAMDLVESGWDIKAMIKTIVMSATYRQASGVTSDLLEKDPLNRLYSRGTRRRLDAESVRDQALALGGLLSRKIGGASVYPVQPDGLWRAAFNGERTWATSKGQDRYRRGLYTFWRRTIPYPSMATFDAPSRENCSVRRIPTNTPLQAFVTMNDPVYVEAAQALGRRIVRECNGEAADRIRFALSLCLSRPPTEEQTEPLLSLFREEREYYSNRKQDAEKLATDPIGPLPVGVDPADAAAWTVVANVLLNLDAVLTKN